MRGCDRMGMNLAYKILNSKLKEGSEFIFSIPINIKEESNNEYNIDRKCKHVERCDIEFSDIYYIK